MTSVLPSPGSPSNTSTPLSASPLPTAAGPPSSWESFIFSLDVIQAVLTFAHLLILCPLVARHIIVHRSLRLNALWPTRLVIVVASFIWCLASLLGNAVLFSPVRGALRTTQVSQEELCLANHFLVLGVSEPIFLFALAFMVRARLASLGAEAARLANRQVLRQMLLWCTPNIIFHVAVVVLNKAASNTPSFLFLAYNRSLFSCSLPMLSVVDSAVVFLAFSFVFQVSAHRLRAIVINRRLRQRVGTLRLVMMVTLFLSQVSRVVALFYQIGAFLDFLPKGNAGTVTISSFRQVYWYGTFFSHIVSIYVLILAPINEARAIPLKREDDGI